MRRFGDFDQYATFSTYDAIPMIELGLGHMALFPTAQFSELRLEAQKIGLTTPDLETAQSLAHTLGADRVAASSTNDTQTWIKYQTTDRSQSPNRQIQVFGNTSHTSSLEMNQDNSLSVETITLYLRRLALPLMSLTMDLNTESIHCKLDVLTQQSTNSLALSALYHIGKPANEKEPHALTRRLPGGQLLEIVPHAPTVSQDISRASGRRWLRRAGEMLGLDHRSSE